MVTVCGSLALAAPERDPAEGGVPPPRVYAIFEPVTTEDDVTLIQRLHPDLLCRGWFKWYQARDYAKDAWIVPLCHQVGSRLQGGVTIAAIYPRENGLSDEQFADFVTVGPDGKRVRIGDWYHVALHNPKVRDYIRGFVRGQIDAGADGIWYDEIDGTYGWEHEGYDEYATTAFRDFLVDRYVHGRGWAPDDERFRTELGIDLAACGGSIDKLDYRAWLAATPGADGKPLAADPWAGPWDRPWESTNPLYRVWGHAWSPDQRLADTFQATSALRFWREFVLDARDYARTHYQRELIITCNENGTARPFVDFQQPHDGSLPRVRADGRLDATYRTLPWLDQHLTEAERVAPGKPVVQFVDWPGETDRMVALSHEDLRTFLHTYIPEAYAAGALFAVPVNGYTYRCRTQGTVPETAAVLDFLRTYDPIVFESTSASSIPVRAAGGGIAAESVAIRVRERRDRVVVHMVDHRPVEERRPARLDLGGLPPSPRVWTVSIGDPIERPVTLTPEGGATLDAFRDSALLVLELQAPKVVGTVRDETGAGVSAATVTLVGDRRSAETDASGHYAFPAGNVGAVAAHAPGHFPSKPGGPDLVLRRAEGRSVAIAVRDSLGCAARSAHVWAEWSRALVDTVSDALGQTQVPVPDGTELSIAADDPTFGTRARRVATIGPDTSEVEVAAPVPDLRVGDFERGSLWTPNDSERFAGRAPVLAVSAVADGPHHEDSRCMEVAVEGLPAGGWANAYSEGCDLTPYTGLRFWYAGDGHPGSAMLNLHIPRGDNQTFYSFALPLDSDRWRDTVVAFAEFSRNGQPPSRDDLRRVSVQVAFAGEQAPGRRSIRLWGLRATLLPE